MKRPRRREVTVDACLGVAAPKAIGKSYRVWNPGANCEARPRDQAQRILQEEEQIVHRIEAASLSCADGSASSRSSEWMAFEGQMAPNHGDVL